MSPPLAVLFADAALVAVHKPAGMLAVPGRGPDKQDCAASRVQAQFADARVVHRLDQATSGLLLFARGAAVQSALAKAFAQRAVHKRYVALVHGHLASASGSIDLPLAADWPARPRQQVDRVRGKPALTHYRVLARLADGTSRLELEPVTGRTHQLRVHLAAIGHAIVGDALYAQPQTQTQSQSQAQAQAHTQAIGARLLLHAAALSFAHPHSGQPIHLQAAEPF